MEKNRKRCDIFSTGFQGGQFLELLNSSVKLEIAVALVRTEARLFKPN